MNRAIAGMILVLMILIPVACAKAQAPEPSVTPAPVPTPAPMPSGASSEDSSGIVEITSDEERMIIRTGDISLVVEDVITARDNISQLAIVFGGYVVSSSVYGEEQDVRGRISIRVPDDKFDQALAEIRDFAVRVSSESTSSTDVTEEYVDLQSRLKNAEATEQQYLVLLSRAEDVEDILSIYERLSRVRSEIEQIKGRMQYLERTSSTSLITVRLEPVASAKPLARAGWNVLEVLKSALRGLVTAGQIIGTIVIWLIIFIPIWGTGLGIFLWRCRRRRKA